MRKADTIFQSSWTSHHRRGCCDHTIASHDDKIGCLNARRACGCSTKMRTCSRGTNGVIGTTNASTEERIRTVPNEGKQSTKYSRVIFLHPDETGSWSSRCRCCFDVHRTISVKERLSGASTLTFKLYRKMELRCSYLQRSDDGSVPTESSTCNTRFTFPVCGGFPAENHNSTKRNPGVYCDHPLNLQRKVPMRILSLLLASTMVYPQLIQRAKRIA